MSKDSYKDKYDMEDSMEPLKPGQVIRSDDPRLPINGTFPPEYASDKREAAINPGHYKDIVPGFEYFDIMDYLLVGWDGSQAAALANAYKYLFRLGKKDEVLQDLGKSLWYLERLKKDLENNGKR